ncbi:glycosyltransferase family 2 protein [Oryzomonas sagensis]|uniref:dolichyl-phosphate beta-glucosyltransferase n=1 Tax=Oryzomonas sagensis TaxID=2603857 RepID=A0ABQ6TKW0_9BACT|nr:dolichyl-phosphate beta-glucosyltransferase [Oryzomonas sagensis]KAB0668836.1 glycosyltransferase family 2 protein [Oryzomonas sagensis]
MISIIIPAYNEENRLPYYLDSILQYLEQKKRIYEILVVDDGSTDATAAVVKRFMALNANVKLIRLPRNRGKGFAVKTGMRQAVGRLRLFADADGATPIEELERLERSIEAGADVAIGSRALLSDACSVKARMHRKLIGAVFNTIVRTMAVRGIRDTQCGFKLFTAGAAARIFSLQQLDGFGFDVEILCIAKRNGLYISEIPINWRDVKGGKIRLIRDSVSMLFDVIRIRINELRNKYAIERMGTLQGEPRK